MNELKIKKYDYMLITQKEALVDKYKLPDSNRIGYDIIDEDLIMLVCDPFGFVIPKRQLYLDLTKLKCIEGLAKNVLEVPLELATETNSLVSLAKGKIATKFICKDEECLYLQKFTGYFKKIGCGFQWKIGKFKGLNALYATMNGEILGFALPVKRTSK